MAVANMSQYWRTPLAAYNCRVLRLSRHSLLKGNASLHCLRTGAAAHVESAGSIRAILSIHIRCSRTVPKTGMHESETRDISAVATGFVASSSSGTVDGTRRGGDGSCHDQCDGGARHAARPRRGPPSWYQGARPLG